MSVYNNKEVKVTVNVPLSFPINRFHNKKYFKELAYIYCVINASSEGICVEF